MTLTSTIRQSAAMACCLILLALAILPATPVLAQDKTILFVYDQNANTGDPNDEDFLYIDIIENQLGYGLLLRGMTEVSPEDTVGVDAIFISESANSGDVVGGLITPMAGTGSANGNFTIPMLSAEVFVWDDLFWMKQGEGFGTDVGHGYANGEILIIPPDPHPILGGLRRGPINVFDVPPATGVDNDAGNQVGYTVPHPSADVVAAVSGVTMFGGAVLPPVDGIRAGIFTYEPGDVLVGADGTELTVRARRVGLWPHRRGGENLNEVGQKLIANSIAWAVGDDASIQTIEAEKPKVLFLFDANANTGTGDEDALKISLLEDELGFEVVASHQAQISPADTAGMALVYMSESASSGDLGGNFVNPMTGGAQYANIGIPVISSEVFIWDEMGWMRTGSEFPTDLAHGYADSDSILISANNHPITSGLEESLVDVYDDPPATGEDNDAANQVGFAVPHESAEIAALLPAEARIGGNIVPTFDFDRATIFTYEIGDLLVATDGTEFNARGRRSSFFPHRRGSENMNQVGQALFMNTVLWATGQEAFITPIGSDPVAAEPEADLPSGFAIESIYPNPFNPTATVALSIQQAGDYQLRVYDVLGRLVESRELSMGQVGRVQLGIELNGQASGMYLVQVTNKSTGRAVSARATLLK